MSLPEIYTDPNAAREHLEALLWPDGPVCARCGVVNEATLLKGKSTRPGVYKCRACEKPFSVTVGTVLEDSKIPLHKWVYAMHLYTASKKGFSAHQLHRTIAVSYKTAWFMAHRIREAMRPKEFTPMGGEGQIVEADETYIGTLEGEGGKEAKRARKADRHRGGGTAHKNIVLTLVERGGSARSFHIDSTSVAKIVPIVRQNIRRESTLMTDEANQYKRVRKEFADDGAVEHGAQEYVRYEERHTVHTNTVEGYYSIFKRGMKGIYQHCSEKHLHRYLSEFDFRYSNRVRLGIDDTQRREIALKGITGKRLHYRWPRGADHD
jgi:transposase-like protein